MGLGHGSFQPDTMESNHCGAVRLTNIHPLFLITISLRRNSMGTSKRFTEIPLSLLIFFVQVHHARIFHRQGITKD